MIGRLEVLPGPGTAARYGDVTVWAGSAATPSLLSFLIQSASNLAAVPDGGRRIADHLAGVLSQRDPEPSVPFVTVGPGERGPVTLLHGPVQMWDGARWLRPDPGIGWMATEVPNLTTVLVTPNDTPAPANANPLLDLRSGVVPGGGLAVVMTPESVVPLDAPPSLEGKPVEAAPAVVTGDEPAAEEEAEPEPAPTAAASSEPAPSDPAAPEEGAAAPEERSTSPDPLGPIALAGAVGAVGALGVTGAAIAATGHPESHTEESHPQVEPEPSASEPSEPEPPEPSTGPAEGASGEGAQSGPESLLDLPPSSAAPLPPVAAGAPTPAGSPTVPGLRCPNGHFNHPRSATCSVCRLPLDQIQGRADGPRPVLGVLVGTDGSLWRVDGGYVVGTDPNEDPDVAAGRIRGLPVPDDGQAEAVHAEIQAHEWAVTVTDRDSRRGTYVLPPGTSDWQKIPPAQPVPVQPGTHVAVGSTVFTFTSPWQL